ncbi:L,D-transpeptidase [Alicyclobacillus shizuokensis]|uniref:L,D-transpeptidase n=1 Tax=Alicyclobacillus shizuokensis TaxID=392014 RepID=UPI0009F93945|nr:L,D-transpeptidase [Alicyclobacillus shizuokensis]MCL6625635.1 L,D-transpeptidase [Alicyclobacillus shizuokensis]
MHWASFRLATAVVLCGWLLAACGTSVSSDTAERNNTSNQAASTNAAPEHALGGQNVPAHQSSPPSEASVSAKNHKDPAATLGSHSLATAQLDSHSTATPTVNWNEPSDGPYPKLQPGEPVWIDVSISQQRMYIKSGQKTLYTMIISSGVDGSKATYTPRGTFYVQPERGTWFYTPRFHEGAKYWVSWLNHGQYLFHSVPMDKGGHVIVKDAEKLGQEDSHGCIHLTIPDAKWVYEHIPTGTKVVIHD